jgi:hypothetical protein
MHEGVSFRLIQHKRVKTYLLPTVIITLVREDLSSCLVAKLNEEKYITWPGG